MDKGYFRSPQRSARRVTERPGFNSAFVNHILGMDARLIKGLRNGWSVEYLLSNSPNIVIYHLKNYQEWSTVMVKQ